MLKSLSFLSLAFVIIFFVSCGKSNPQQSLPVEQFFETNILNRKFVVSFAQDSAVDITSDYNGYFFILQETDLYHGPLQVTNGSNTYTGTWACDSDYGKLTITLPDTPAIFQFLTRDWRFVSKNIPTIQVSPWGTTQPYFLNMTRQ